MLLHTLAVQVKRCNWLCYAYCLMTNHYSLVLRLCPERAGGRLEAMRQAAKALGQYLELGSG